MRRLSFSRGEHRIFRELDLTIPRGKVTAIMGPSGTGKTTLLRLIGGQIRPDAGRIEVDGICPRTRPQGSGTNCASAWACCSRAARCSPT